MQYIVYVSIGQFMIQTMVSNFLPLFLLLLHLHVSVIFCFVAVFVFLFLFGVLIFLCLEQNNGQIKRKSMEKKQMEMIKYHTRIVLLFLQFFCLCKDIDITVCSLCHFLVGICFVEMVFNTCL